jgi:hydroxyacylglutathione hydrolase
MKLIPLPAFQANDPWFVHDGHRALVVGPGDAQPVMALLQREGLELGAILVTQHSPDRAGGVDPLREGRWKSWRPSRRNPCLLHR